MTRTTNARIAGFTYLFYIAVAFPATVLLTRATSGDGTAARLAGLARHATDVRLAVVRHVARGADPGGRSAGVPRGCRDSRGHVSVPGLLEPARWTFGRNFGR
jgi:hypothetical protein